MTREELVEFGAEVLLCPVSVVKTTAYADILTADEAKAKRHFDLLVEKFPGSAWELLLIEDWEPEVEALFQTSPQGSAYLGTAKCAMGFNMITNVQQIIAINMKGLSTWTQRLHILLHECAHTLLMTNAIRGPRSEPYAETIAWLATRELLGDVTRGFSTAYVAGSLMNYPDEVPRFMHTLADLLMYAEFLVKATQRPGTW